jgi:hypothetical protein
MQEFQINAARRSVPLAFDPSVMGGLVVDSERAGSSGQLNP